MSTCRTQSVLSKTGFLIVLVAGLAFGSPGRVEAGTIMEYYDDASASWKLISSSPAPATSVGFFTTGGFELYSLTAISNVPGSATFAFLAGTSALVWNKNASTATIRLTFGADGFLAPTAPPDAIIQSHIGATVFADPVSVPVSAAHVSMTTYVDELGRSGNLVFTTFPPPTYAFANPDPLLASGSGSSDASITASSLGSSRFGYSVVQQVTVTLAANEKLNFVTNTTISPAPAVPEPSTLVLWGTGIAVMLGYGAKRRLQEPAAA